MKKKLIAGMMVAMMTVGMVMPVSAADPQPAASGETKVSYTEGNNWNVTIPAKVDLYTDKGTSSQITASMVNIEPGRTLQISVSSGISGGKVTLNRENGDVGDTITSTVSLAESGTGIADDAVVAEFSGSQFEGTITPTSGGTLYFSKLEGTNIKAGSYTGTINFVMNVADSSVSGN